MQERIFHVRGALAIPVGHRVEVTTFGLNTGFFGPQLSPQPYDPCVRDLNTGVVYARTWHYHHEVTDITKLPLQFRSDLAVVERVIGQVVATRVLSGQMPDEKARHGWVTTLVVMV